MQSATQTQIAQAKSPQEMILMLQDSQTHNNSAKHSSSKGTGIGISQYPVQGMPLKQASKIQRI